MNTQNVKTLNAAKFRGTALFSIGIHQYGNRAKVKNADALGAFLVLMAKVDTKGEGSSRIEGSTSTKRVNASKVLLKHDALDAVNEFLRLTKKRCLVLCMPSNIREGMFCAKLAPEGASAEDIAKSPVSQIAAIMAEAAATLRDELLPELRIALPAAYEQAKRSPICLKEDGSGEWEEDDNGGLGPLFDPADYPRIRPEGTAEDVDIETLPLDLNEILSKFSFDWNLLSLTIPEGLPPELRESESAKLHQAFSDAASEMKDALRVMLAKMIEHAVTTLTPDAGGKKKKFHSTLVTNLDEFFKTFEAKNIMEDGDLAAVVAQCRAVMQDDSGAVIEAETLRTNDNVRELTAKKLEEIKNALAPLVAECQSRTFDFSE